MRKIENNEPVEAEQIGHSADGEIRHEVHPASVNGIDRGFPISERAPVRIGDGEVKRGIT